MKFANSKKQGDAGLGAAIRAFTTKGYTVSLPLTDSQDYDLIVEIDDKLLKVQVKTTSHLGKSGVYEVGLRTCGGNRSGTSKSKYFDSSRIDLLFVLAGDGKEYLIPTTDFEAKTSLYLGKNKEKYILGV